MKTKISRRELLKTAVLFPAVALMAACANIPVGIDQPTAAPANPPEPTAKPNTETPSPTTTVKPSATRAAPTRTATVTPEPTETPGPSTITFDLADGTLLEMRRFETASDGLEYIQGDTTWRKGDVYQQTEAMMLWADEESSQRTILWNKVKQGPGYTLVMGFSFVYPTKGEDYFLMFLLRADDGKTILGYSDVEGTDKAVYVNIDVYGFRKVAEEFQYSTPTPQP